MSAVGGLLLSVFSKTAPLFIADTHSFPQISHLPCLITLILQREGEREREGVVPLSLLHHFTQQNKMFHHTTLLHQTSWVGWKLRENCLLNNPRLDFFSFFFPPERFSEGYC